ncbi:hypothetical protein [Methylobacterium sp. MA0201]|uniref:hypothetical protein n=1 Tax=Methylobacterium alsaeris TaxID=3344826 RepID=UPI0037583FC8
MPALAVVDSYPEGLFNLVDSIYTLLVVPELRSGAQKPESRMLWNKAALLPLHLLPIEYLNFGLRCAAPK